MGQVQRCPREIFQTSTSERPKQEREQFRLKVRTLYRAVCPDDPMDADRAGIYKAWVRVNAAAYKKHKNEQQQQNRYTGRKRF